jgi:hypothetical protein
MSIGLIIKINDLSEMIGECIFIKLYNSITCSNTMFDHQNINIKRSTILSFATRTLTIESTIVSKRIGIMKVAQFENVHMP